MGQRFGTSTIDLEVLREFCEHEGKKVIITEGNVFRNGHFIGKCITDDQGNKFVSGIYNNGIITML